MKRFLCVLVILLTATMYAFAARNFYTVKIIGVGENETKVITVVNTLTHWGLKASKDSIKTITGSHSLTVLTHQYKNDAYAAVDSLTKVGATVYVTLEVVRDPLADIGNTGIYSIKLKNAGSNKAAVREALCDIFSPDCAPTDETLQQAQSIVNTLGWIFKNISPESADCIINYLTAVGAEVEKVQTYIPYCGPGVNDDGTRLSGAYYTGNYTSPFKMYLGKTDEEIQAKLDSLWNHYFAGNVKDKEYATVYYETDDEAYIKDVYNNDVRSEGMGYGMMICVQTDHQKEFDKLWNWTKNHMWHKDGEWDGYFSWHWRLDGTGRSDESCAPNAEMYIMMSLLFAANRWNDSAYMEDAQYILNKMWHNSNHKLINQQSYIISFQPTQGNDTFTDPSYNLPTFVDLFSRWSRTDKDKWNKTTTATRNYLNNASHQKSGLFTVYANFDGTPHYAYSSISNKYMHDAVQCAMNFGMDYYLFGADKEHQSEMAKRIIDFFEEDNYEHADFNWDGTDPQGKYTEGQAGCYAVACYALIGNKGYDDAIRRNLQKAWNVKPIFGPNRYYNGILHYLAMLHLCGSFKIWKPAKDAEAMRDLCLGDANGDGSVTMADANMVVNYYLTEDKSTVKDFVFHFADANEDGEISMADANQIVNIFLSK